MQYITLVLENSEEIRLFNNQITDFHIRGVKQNISQSRSDCMDYYAIDELYLVVDQEANRVEVYTDDMIKRKERMLPFDRILKYRDIVAIETCHDDGCCKYMYVPWQDGRHEDDNRCQIASVTKGILKIDIKRRDLSLISSI